MVGDKVAVLSGVHIGNNVIVAANAVVTKDLPDWCVAAGVPARVVKMV
jgi:maltose O-acetyltransferase